jgi:hypothetical protein
MRRPLRTPRGHRGRTGGWALVAIARDELTAEAWQALLADEGIEAQVRIDDAAKAGMPSRTLFPLGYIEPGRSLFSYPLYVRAADRRVARQVLRDRADFSGPSIDRRAILGALAVVLGSFALVIVLLLRDA